MSNGHRVGIIRKIEASDWPRSADVWRHGCSVYLIEEGYPGPVKIGIAEHPIRRLSTHQCGNPRELHLRAVFCGSRKDCALVETAIKIRFRKSILRGEWIAEPLAVIFAELEACAQ